MLKKIGAFFNNIERNICVVLLMVMIVDLTFQVILRYCFQSSNSWSEEAARYMFIWLVFLGMSYAEKEFIHIKIESLQCVFPKIIRKYVALVGEIIFLAFSLYLMYISYGYMMMLVGQGQISQGLHISMGWVYLSMPLSFALLSIRIIISILTKKYAKTELVDFGDVNENLIRKSEKGNEVE